MKKFTSEKLSVIESFIFSIVKSYEIFFASPTYVKYKFAKYSCSIMISQNQYILLFVDDVDSYTTCRKYHSLKGLVSFLSEYFESKQYFS